MWPLSLKPNPSENVRVVVIIIIKGIVVVIIRRSRICSNSRNDRWIKETGEGTIHHENVRIGGNEELSRRLKPLDRSDEVPWETKNLFEKKNEKKWKKSPTLVTLVTAQRSKKK